MRAGQKLLSLKRQADSMSMYPQLSLSLKKGMATWKGPWQPRILCNTYEIQVVYRFPIRPVISILTPILQLAKGKMRLPHVYRGGQNDICVHVKSDWNASMRIANTIMPWLSEWLYFYEVWLQTGAWIGKGTHPELPEHSDKAA